jgi:hypothetical protein
VFAVEGVVGIGDELCGGVGMVLGYQCHCGQCAGSQAGVMTRGRYLGDRVIGDQVGDTSALLCDQELGMGDIAA